MHRTDKYSQHISIIWPVWLNGRLFVFRIKWLWVRVPLQEPTISHFEYFFYFHNTLPCLVVSAEVNFAIFERLPRSCPVYFHEIYVLEGKAIKTKLLTQKRSKKLFFCPLHLNNDTCQKKKHFDKSRKSTLTLSGRRPISYRNQISYRNLVSI